MSTQPEIIDFRFGPKDHRCGGTWQYRGKNAGGHDIFWCPGGHWGIDMRYSDDQPSQPDPWHECTDACASVEITEREG